ncbi:MAG TPA: hypothetical protein VGA34_05270 [Alteraurantiacibacter sp.]|jgi:hypothetical protein
MFHDTQFTAGGRVPDTVLVDVVRCWRAARAKGYPVQPELHALLGPAGYDMLAPAFDSLLQLCESWLDSETCAGCPLATPDGEHLLCRLLKDPMLLDRIGPCHASEGISCALACALRSVNFLVGKAMRP